MILRKVILQIIIPTTVLIIASCDSTTEKLHDPRGSSTVENNQQQTISIQTQKPLDTSQLSLDNFKGIPDEVLGCACYFSETDQKFKKNEYLFAASFDSVGYVFVENRPVKLKLVSTGREPNSFGDDDHIDIYQSEHYIVTVDIKYIKSNGDETWWNNGMITIESKDGQKLSKKFVGECGC